MNKQALMKAIEVCGSQAELARRIVATTAQVNEWTKGGRPVPALRCWPIEAATDGEVRCEELRPDLDWTRDAAGRPYYAPRVAQSA